MPVPARGGAWTSLSTRNLQTIIDPLSIDSLSGRKEYFNNYRKADIGTGDSSVGLSLAVMQNTEGAISYECIGQI